MKSYFESISESNPLVVALRYWLGSSKDDAGRWVDPESLMIQVKTCYGKLGLEVPYKNVNGFGSSLRKYESPLNTLGFEQRRTSNGIDYRFQLGEAEVHHYRRLYIAALKSHGEGFDRSSAHYQAKIEAEKLERELQGAFRDKRRILLRRGHFGHGHGNWPGADTSVGNAGRISRVAMTLNIKGEDSEDRPWRYARVLTCPEMEPVSREQIDSIIAEARESIPRRKALERRELNVNEAQVQQLLDNLEAEGVLFVNTITRKNGCTYWALDECPFKGGEHEGMEVGAGKTCIVLSQTALGFSCFAGSCSEYTFGDFHQAAPQRARHQI